jgi:hypothetical protein
MTETDRTIHRWWLSDGFLKGDDLDLEAQRTLVLATSSFLNGNAETMQDLQAYDAYRFFSVEDPSEAVIYLERMSPRLRATLEQPGGPFDDAYLKATYAEAQALIAQAGEIETQANQIDDQNRIYELAGLIFAIGLASTAWASLLHPNRQTKTVFLVIAVICILAGAVVLIWTL